jgi:simple sugar transport system permease protein
MEKERTKTKSKSRSIEEQKLVKDMLKGLRFKEIGGLSALVIIFAFFGILNSQFFSMGNMVTILTFASELGIVTLGVNLVMITGEFDMSVASIYALVPLLFEELSTHGIPSLIALLIVLLFAIGEGFMNGFITTRGHIPSFITTLGTEWLWRGVVLAITGGYFVTLTKGVEIVNFFGGKISDLGLRLSSVWFIVLTVIFYFILEWTAYGNRIQASGGSPDTADSLGVISWKYKTSTFMISGLMAGIAGIATFARFKTIDPSLGTNMELQAITASVIGGTLMTGGYGSAFGALLGAIILSSLSNGLVLIGAPTFWYQSFIGVILVGAALINIFIKKRLVGE